MRNQNGINRVVLECKGRMANQILCWANAVHVFEQAGITDRLIVINYPDLSRATFPANTRVEFVANVSNLPRVRRQDIAKEQGDCLWVWEDIFAAFPEESVMKKIIKTIQFPFSPLKPRPVGIHARYGDYVSIDEASPPPVRPPFIRASNNYFRSAMQCCRVLDPDCTFYLASDGTDEELAFITNQPHVIRGVKDTPALDLFCLSQSRLIIGSSSTFSSVAACYGDVPLIMPGMNELEVVTIITSAL